LKDPHDSEGTCMIVQDLEGSWRVLEGPEGSREIQKDPEGSKGSIRVQESHEEFEGFRMTLMSPKDS
jgi:hypothetical protein